MQRSLAVLLALGLMTTSLYAATPRCPPIAGSEALLRPGAHLVVAFDVPHDPPAHIDRELEMAKTLAAAVALKPKATFVSLVGNLHARKAAHPQYAGTFMAQHLVRLGQSLLTLDARYDLGSSWVCMPDCGPHPIGHGTTARGITMKPSADGAYDGVFAVGAPSFALPAARSPSPEQQRMAERIPLALSARRAYDDGQLARCGALNVELARRAPAATIDYAYTAGCCYARAGDADRALAQLAAAIAAGFDDGAGMAEDSDLQSLHGDPRWPPLLARIVAKKQRP